MCRTPGPTKQQEASELILLCSYYGPRQESYSQVNPNLNKPLTSLPVLDVFLELGHIHQDAGPLLRDEGSCRVASHGSSGILCVMYYIINDM